LPKHGFLKNINIKYLFGEEKEVDIRALTRRILHTLVKKMQYRREGGACGSKGIRAKDE